MSYFIVFINLFLLFIQLVCLFVLLYIWNCNSRAENDSVLRTKHTPLLESLITLIEFLTLVITMAIIIPIIIAGVMISIVSLIIELIAYYDFYSFLMKCQAQDLLLYCDL